MPRWGDLIPYGASNRPYQSCVFPSPTPPVFARRDNFNTAAKANVRTIAHSALEISRWPKRLLRSRFCRLPVGVMFTLPMHDLWRSLLRTGECRGSEEESPWGGFEDEYGMRRYHSLGFIPVPRWIATQRFEPRARRVRLDETCSMVVYPP